MKSFFKYAKYSMVLVSVAFIMPYTVAFAGEAMTVVSFGGAYTKSQIEAYHKPFSAKTGVKLNSEDYGGGTAEIRAQVQSGNVAWDVVDVEKQDLQAACDEGLLVPIDWSTLPPAPDGTPATEDFLPGGLHECGVATIVWSTIIAYDKTKFP